MFTGIISQQATFRGYRQGRKEMLVEAPGLAAKLAAGESVAVNGVCLSLLPPDREGLRFNLSR
ncbi:MAG: riboflavin synthase, partial [Acidobacteria bacterium]|nr:riboflavin synthase [Acidobacteriota bacterium]